MKDQKMPQALVALQRKELWEQCVEWLRAASVLSRSDNFAKLPDFAAALRNGVLLCELALRLRPGSIDRHEILLQYQQSPFTCSKNIALFLSACRRHFGIEGELFSEDDLYGLQNFGAVLRLLSQLSRTQTSRQLGLRPFPEETTLPSELEEDDNIYSNLREEVEKSQSHSDNNSNNTNNSQSQSQYAILSNKKDDEDGRKIYDTICGQNAPKNRKLPISYSEFKPTNKREHCLKELLDTEINYDSALQRIVDIFYARLHFYLATEDMATIFINIREILRVNLDFLAKLEPAVLRSLNIESPSSRKKEEPLTVAELFISFKERFTIYGKYCSLLSASTSRIEELERSEPEFKKIITDLARDGQFRLQALLCIPFQRITKYHLILEHLVNYSQQDVGEGASLNNAYDSMKDVCDYVNEMKRDHDAIEFVNTIERSIACQDLRLLDYGRLLCDDYVKTVISGHCGSSKQRYVFLFEKMMMLSKREGGLYKKKGHLLMCDFELAENELDSSSSTGTGTGSNTLRSTHTLSRKLTNGFFDHISLTITRRGEDRNNNNSNNTNYHNNTNEGTTTPISSVQLVFKSVKQRDEWREAVRRAIDACNPRAGVAKGHTLLYKTYDSVVNCAICQLLLRGKFFQGYHCSGCNRDMHRMCVGLRECVLNSSRSSRRSTDLSSLIVNGSDSNKTAAGGGDSHSSTLSSPGCAQNFFPGEIVVARQQIVVVPQNGGSAVASNRRLSCQNGDFIELLEVNAAERTALGRLTNRPQAIGVVPLDGLIKRASTLERMRRRPSRTSNNSLSEVITLQSPTRIASPPIQFQQQSPKSSFVSSHIITLSEHRDDVTEQPWYFGELSRGEARQLLEDTAEGTFIVRWSAERQQFAISFSAAGGSVKHVKVEYDAALRKYYLYNTRFFDSVVELVNFYRVNSLSEGFSLDAVLRGTLLKGSLYRAVSAYCRPDSSRYLTLRPGDLVTVLDTAGDGNGWWKGAVASDDADGQRIGFFPVSYVEKVAELAAVGGVSVVANGHQSPEAMIAATYQNGREMAAGQQLNGGGREQHQPNQQMNISNSNCSNYSNNSNLMNNLSIPNNLLNSLDDMLSSLSAATLNREEERAATTDTDTTL